MKIIAVFQRYKNYKSFENLNIEILKKSKNYSALKKYG